MQLEKHGFMIFMLMLVRMDRTEHFSFDFLLFLSNCKRETKKGEWEYSNETSFMNINLHTSLKVLRSSCLEF